MPGGAIVTLLFTSLEASTTLLERLGDVAFGELRHVHLRLLRSVVASHHGEEVKNLGDGLMVVFGSAVDAVSAAIEMQQAVERHNQASGGPDLAVRIGLHVGEPIAEEADYFGTPVVIARRLCDTARPGQILASALVRELVGTRGAFTFSAVGELALKGFAVPFAANEVAWRPQPQDDVDTAIPAALTQQMVEVFVGRENEVQRLDALAAKAAAGARRAVLVAGEPGIGKTRLSSEAARRAVDAGARVLYGRCDEDPALPYQPFVEALRGLIGSSPVAVATHGSAAAQLGRLLPEFGDPRPETEPFASTEPGADRYALFEVVAELLAAESRRRPLVLVLDDLHWAPKPTVLLVRHVLRHSAPMSMLVIGNYRDTELGRGHPLAELLADLRRDTSVERIVLGGLDERAVAAYVDALAGPERADRGLGAALHAETGGNPFFVREVLLHLLDTEASAGSASTALRHAGLPESVSDVIARRVGQLAPDTQRTLQIAAVIGNAFDVHVLEGVPELGLDSDAVLDALDEAVGAGVLAEEGWTYRFSHELVRQSVYAGMLGARRAQLHGRVAQAIESMSPTSRQASELAHHYAVATRVRTETAPKALQYARLAGGEAMSQLAFEQAVDHFTSALATLDALPSADASERADLLLETAVAARAAGDPRRSMELAQRAADIATTLGSAELLARAALVFEDATWIAQGFMDQAAIQPAFQLLTGALDAIGPETSELRVSLLTRLPRVLYFSAPPDEKLRYAEEASTHAAAVAKPAARAAAAEATRWALWGTGDLDALRDVSDEMLTHAVAADDLQLQVRARVWRFLARLDLGDLQGVDAEIAALEDLNPALRDPLSRWYPPAARAMRALLEGRLVDAETYALEAFGVADRSDLQWAVTNFGIQLFFIRREQGSLAELEEPTRRLAARSPFASTRSALADLYCQLGKTDDARQEFERFADENFDVPHDFGWLVCIGMLADVCGALGDTERAATLYRVLSPHGGRNLVVAPGIVCMGSTDRNLGVLASTLGEWDTADGHFEAAAAFNIRLNAPPWTARTALDWAAMLRCRGAGDDLDRASRLADEALAIADQFHLQGIRDAAASV